jgi:2-methylcitrate dehydratase PrpD
MTTPILFRLANLISKIAYRNLPENVVYESKMHVLDTLGVDLAGSIVEANKIIVNVIRKFGGGNSTIIGSGMKTLSPYAALANSAMAQTLELDDGHRGAGLHPGAVVIPSALAVGEEVGASGKELITSIVAGYEAMIRIGIALHPAQHLLGHHNTVTCGVFGAAAAACKLLNMEVKSIADALAIGASIALLGPEGFLYMGSMVKGLPAGISAHNGIISALLAKGGFSGPECIFEGDKGFVQALVGKDGSRGLEKVTSELDKQYKISEAYYKLHASCRHTHPAIDAILELLRRHDKIDVNRIHRIRVITYPVAAAFVCDPKDEISAKFSIPYCIAIAILDQKVCLDAFSSERLRSPEVKKLLNKIEVLADSNIDYPAKRTTKVEIIFSDGSAIGTELDYPRGEPESPISEEEIKQKFTSLAKKRVGGGKCKEILGLTTRLEEVDNIKSLMQKLGDFSEPWGP